MANLKMRGSAEERELLKNEKGDLGVTLVRSADSREREELFFLFSQDWWGALECWAPSMRQGDTEVTPGKGTNIIAKQERLSYKERLRELELFSLEQRRLNTQILLWNPYDIEKIVFLLLSLFLAIHKIWEDALVILLGGFFNLLLDNIHKSLLGKTAAG